jgi:hypothetical protein
MPPSRLAATTTSTAAHVLFFVAAHTSNGT